VKQYGLIGKVLGHSFSPGYFTTKFSTQHIQASYRAFELTDISEFSRLIQQHEFAGLNVTIPYKESIIPFLDELTPVAQAIDAVNTLIFKGGQVIGHNTDAEGFWADVSSLIQHTSKQAALILGTGGSSKAVAYALTSNGWEVKFVSRTSKADLTYPDLTPSLVNSFGLIVNTTPVGMYPDTNEMPPFPVEFITADQIVYDLIYNPEETLFLQRCKANGCKIRNGYGMLVAQAELSYTTWEEHV